LQLEVEKKEVETEKHLKIMSEKEMVSRPGKHATSHALLHRTEMVCRVQVCCSKGPYLQMEIQASIYWYVPQNRITGEIQQLEKERHELEDRTSNLQHQIFKGSEKLDQFKLLMNWNQEELEQWALAQKQKEEDNLALEKYR
jgi:hypothetical protein